MFISVDASKIQQVNAILRDLNFFNGQYGTDAYEPVSGATHLINMRDSQSASDVIIRLKKIGAFIAVTSTA